MFISKFNKSSPDTPEIFISFEKCKPNIKEIPTLSNNEKRDLLNISNTTLQQLQTGDVILFRNMPYINNVIWPTAASIVITKNIILKKTKKKSIKKKKLLNK